uniref:adhesion G-protein coupled receptor D2-like n=1 Tax=Halichoerus grypus TaxID=9711 RepID=UPI001659E5FE|nr:adhesion G-protein coupled receptor D2-like [Halichoerus grypus]
MPHGHPEGPGHIRIPASEVKQLLGKGLSRVTVIHSWFSSSVFQHTLGEPGLEPQASHSSEEASKMQRFLSTQVGSAIISSEVWDETREVSTAVTFHLQHQAQDRRPRKNITDE